MLDLNDIRKLVKESIQENFDVTLFENYGQLEDVIILALGSVNQRYEVNDLMEFVIELASKGLGYNSTAMDIEDYATDIVEIFRTLVKRNVKLIDGGGRNDPRYKEAGFWYRLTKDNVDAGRSDTPLFMFLGVLRATLRVLSERRDMVDNKDTYKVIHKDANFVLFKPEHKAAACRLGANTKWCISARGSDNYFDDYNRNGDVYIIHTKNDKYAVIMSNGVVKEIQHSGNTYDAQSREQYEEFVSLLKRDGVDLGKLDSLIGSNFKSVVPQKKFEIQDVELISDMDKNMSISDNIAPFDSIENFYLTATIDGQTEEIDGIVVAKKDGETFVVTTKSMNQPLITTMALKFLPLFNRGKTPQDEVINNFGVKLREELRSKFGSYEMITMMQYVQIAKD